MSLTDVYVAANGELAHDESLADWRALAFALQNYHGFSHLEAKRAAISLKRHGTAARTKDELVNAVVSDMKNQWTQHERILPKLTAAVKYCPATHDASRSMDTDPIAGIDQAQRPNLKLCTLPQDSIGYILSKLTQMQGECEGASCFVESTGTFNRRVVMWGLVEGVNRLDAKINDTDKEWREKYTAATKGGKVGKGNADGPYGKGGKNQFGSSWSQNYGALKGKGKGKGKWW